MNNSTQVNQRIYSLLFEHLALAQRAPMRLKPNAVLLPAGATSEHVYCVAEGSVHVELYPQSTEGARVIPMHFHAGMVLLVHTAYDQLPDPGSMVASRETVLYPVAHREFREVMHASVERLEYVTQFLAARLTEARKRERQWIERGVQERVAMALDYMAGEKPLPHAQAGIQHIEATHEHIAERSGVSRAKASRELKRLEQAGHIRLARRGLEILDRQALKRDT